jgi:hypothetical protein
MPDAEDLVVIPLPTLDSGITYATARLVEENGRPFAEAIVAIPNTAFAPPKRISLSLHSLTRLRAGQPGRPSLYLYEGMILPPP